jgi:hypothetical protein
MQHERFGMLAFGRHWMSPSRRAAGPHFATYEVAA